MNIGDRQTVQRAKHPTLGEGRLVYDNGPCFFLADSGEVEHYDKADFGGVGSAQSSRGRYREHHAWKGYAQTVFDTLDRECGPKHQRIVTQDGRPGWLVSWDDATSRRERFNWERFEPDDGSAPETMMIQRLWVGGAGDWNSRKKLENLHPWRSMGSIGGHTFTFRLESDPAPAENAAPKRSAKKAAPRGPMPGPNATRAEIDAWRKSA